MYPPPLRTYTANARKKALCATSHTPPNTQYIVCRPFPGTQAEARHIGPSEGVAGAGPRGWTFVKQ